LYKNSITGNIMADTTIKNMVITNGLLGRIKRIMQQEERSFSSLCREGLRMICQKYEKKERYDPNRDQFV